MIPVWGQCPDWLRRVPMVFPLHCTTNNHSPSSLAQFAATGCTAGPRASCVTGSPSTLPFSHSALQCHRITRYALQTITRPVHRDRRRDRAAHRRRDRAAHDIREIADIIGHWYHKFLISEANITPYQRRNRMISANNIISSWYHSSFHMILIWYHGKYYMVYSARKARKSAFLWYHIWYHEKNMIS